MMPKTLKAPFPYFGGKASIASIVWRALGNPAHYIEPFFGSGAVLLARPHKGVLQETVCDKDGLLANVWRALQAAPDEVARWCDWPVNHADLNARRRVMIAEEPNLCERLGTDDTYYNAKIAGYWVWAASCWIGSGLTSLNAMPHVSDTGRGVHALGKVPHVSDTGKGVHALGKVPHVSNTGRGVQEPYADHIYTWFRALSERLRYVRVVCGDWTLVCGGNWQTRTGTCGIFFDPPYGIEDRDDDIYAQESLTVSHDVAKWAHARGGNKEMRIVIAGYSDEHAWLLKEGWTAHAWRAQGGYANLGKAAGKNNRHRETLFMSPHCTTQTIDDLAVLGANALHGEEVR